ncbi:MULTISPECIES: ribonuclease HIII [Bacillaceae]|uniref:Ribonuclease HIII n=1 Tax=Evansella alkalicola TaxID=745819 RepID=A0ABS6JVM8_9BACI|nr:MULTISPECIES: ribonuclease HIII [Bacillaceae]MBU9721185.1 ribonuclease HIII [Bacillus alkalicola]
MSYEVLKVSKKTLDDMKKDYQNFLKVPAPQGAVFAAKTGGCSITGYQSGKVLFQGKEATMEARKWQGNITSSSSSSTGSTKSAKKSVDSHSYQPPGNLPNLVLLGSDETGTGDYFGPMTVVCAHLSESQMKTIENWGIKDSKMINDTTIKELAPRLIKECTYSLLVLKNEKYNSLQESGMNQGQMKALLHHQAITNVMKKCQEEGLNYEGVLIDQFVTPPKYFDYLKTKGKKWESTKPIYFATKAENLHPAVAAASVLARYSFLNEMDKLEKEVGLPIPKGAGPKVDQAARLILQTKGKDTLYRCSKWHFANTNKAMRG